MICVYIIIFYFATFGCYLLEACPFLVRDKKGVDPDGQGCREELGVVEAGGIVIRLYHRGKIIYFQ